MTRDAFLSFCEDFAPVSHSQRFQDLFCLWVAGLKHDGYFVEFGALSGINMSNSYLLEQIGWTGIVAEPHPAFGDRLRANRRAHVVTDCVWTTSGETIPFHAVKGKPALSTIGNVAYDDIQNAAGARDRYVVHEVPTISLLDMLDRADAPAFIDCLSVDTEGSELEILQAFDFNAYRFGAVVVEHGFSSKREAIHALLTSHGYARLWPELSGHDDWYAHAACLPDSPPDGALYRELAAALAPLEPVAQLGKRLRILAEFYKTADAPDACLRALQAAAAELPESAAVHSELAQSYAALGMTHSALRAYDQALSLNPNLGPARRRRNRLARGPE